MLDVHLPCIVVIAIGSPSSTLDGHQVVKSARKQAQEVFMESETALLGLAFVCLWEELFVLSLTKHLLCAGPLLGFVGHIIL